MSARLIQSFGAVEDVRVAVAPRRRGEVGGVRADARLGQAERGQLLAARLRHEPALLLLLGRPTAERQRVEPDVDAHDHAEGRVGALELLAQDAQADVVHARRRRSAPGSARPGSRARPSASKTSRWTSSRCVPLADVGRDLGRGELAHRLPGRGGSRRSATGRWACAGHSRTPRAASPRLGAAGTSERGAAPGTRTASVRCGRSAAMVVAVGERGV